MHTRTNTQHKGKQSFVSKVLASTLHASGQICLSSSRVFLFFLSSYYFLLRLLRVCLLCVHDRKGRQGGEWKE